MLLEVELPAYAVPFVLTLHGQLNCLLGGCAMQAVLLQCNTSPNLHILLSPSAQRQIYTTDAISHAHLC